ncbi:MAG TPA: hypothetical protein VG347_01365, partial [Verrucomicrobiae bacterium]|nr:hypothetical protein [Verrucomicrobiae bacterium]
VTFPAHFRLMNHKMRLNLRQKNCARRLTTILAGWLVILLAHNSRAQTLQLVQPSQTDTNITQFNNYHYAYLNSGVPARHQLFVFLPGTGGAPAGYTDILKTAANLGFHTLGLMYEDPNTMNSLCGDLPDPNGYRDTRLAVINGGTNAQIAIARADSITNRLVKALLYLAAKNPSQNWGQYLDAQSNVNWPLIVIAGHSQGAGHSGLIAKTYPVARSLMFSDTDWWTPDGQLPGQPASWISTPGVTAAEYYFGFVHVQDPLIPYIEEIPTWNGYGLAQFGGPLLVESNAAPFFGSHMLTTDVAPFDGNYHGATVADSATPLAADGVTPLYQPVWQFLLTGPPEPPALQITRQSASQFQISCLTFSNYTYQMQTATNLRTAWNNIGSSASGNGAAAIFNCTNTTPAQFFRVTVQY